MMVLVFWFSSLLVCWFLRVPDGLDGEGGEKEDGMELKELANDVGRGYGGVHFEERNTDVRVR